MSLSGNPYYIAEDNDMRSSYVKELLHDSLSFENSFGGSTIQKVIMQYWHNKDCIPHDVQDCLDSWVPLTKQGFKRFLFDDEKARQYISKELGNTYVKAFNQCHHPAMRSDYFRLCFILTNGGFYIDADEMYQGVECDHLFINNKLKIQPLCYDISTDLMIEPSIFLQNNYESVNWIYYFNNNPLLAPANHPVIRLALNRSTRILLDVKEKHIDIQSITGPGNLTASLVRHSILLKTKNKVRDYCVMPNWEEISVSQWPLSYRIDKRNWRLWDGTTII